MTLKDFCKKYGLTIEQATGKQDIKDSLDLSSLTTLPEGCQLSAGDSLDLSSLTTLPEGCQLSAGGSLYLRSHKIYRGDKVSEEVLRSRYLWRNKEYIKVDGIFTKIISERGNVSIVRLTGKDKKML